MDISIIVSTYNQPGMLKLVLMALNEQTFEDFEVVIADDGSTDKTAEMIKKIMNSLNFRLKHVWHEDFGFRAAAIRNKAVAASEGEYLIFLDGDCIPFSSFLNRHLKLREKGWFVRGNRAMLSRKFTQFILENGLPIYEYPIFKWIKHRLKNNLKRIFPLVYLPMGKYRKNKSTDWYGVKTCNLGMWRNDFELVNGFDEQFIGWGREDADLAVRLFNNGVCRKEGIFATCVLHLWHPESDRNKLEENDALLQQHIEQKTMRAIEGYSNHLSTE